MRLSRFVGVHESSTPPGGSSVAGRCPTHRIEAPACGVVHKFSELTQITLPGYPSAQGGGQYSCDAGGSARVTRGGMRLYKPMQNHDYFTYEEFGRRFFEVAVTPERVAAAL